ncbi:hypothetical protein [uncultured Tenacibaculum sp.]|uniref:hypothetical protein n=1 Tax=uncultured Tenacibaculum sp. TaxID=174713 RepID=UPI0026100FC0|nr:hypothetical protein [uncultured Tenacibaculum sp.]
MKKDESIIELITEINKEIGESKYFLKDFWEGDLCAIGFSDLNEEILIYVSTFEREKGNYYIEIEKSNKEFPDKYDMLDRKEKVNFKELKSILQNYL